MNAHGTAGWRMRKASSVFRGPCDVAIKPFAVRHNRVKNRGAFDGTIFQGVCDDDRVIASLICSARPSLPGHDVRGLAFDVPGALRFGIVIRVQLEDDVRMRIFPSELDDGSLVSNIFG